MSPVDGYLNFHVRKAVHLQHGRINHLPLEIQPTLICAWWHTEQLSEIGYFYGLYAIISIGAQADKLIERNGIFTSHRIGDFAPYASPTVGAVEDHAQTLGNGELHRGVVRVLFIRIRCR